MLPSKSSSVPLISLALANTSVSERLVFIMQQAAEQSQLFNPIHTLKAIDRQIK